MKFIIALVVAFFQIQSSSGQILDTLRIYNYVSMLESWKVQMDNVGHFTLSSNQWNPSGEIIAKGTYRKNDSIIRFFYDSASLKNKNLKSEKVKQFSNIPFLLNGDTFKCAENYFIPHNILVDVGETVVRSNGLFGKYALGNGYSNYIIEICQDSTYKITDHSCMASFFIEKGKWRLNGRVLIFESNDETESILDWFTTKRTLYISEEYLIGRKIEKSTAKVKKSSIEETYNYWLKQPVFLTE